MLIALCQSTCLQVSVFYHHHEENEASYTVWLCCSKDVDYFLSEWLICISSYTLFTRMVCSSKSERAQTKNTSQIILSSWGRAWANNTCIGNWNVMAHRPWIPYSGKFSRAQIFVNHWQTRQEINFAIFIFATRSRYLTTPPTISRM